MREMMLAVLSAVLLTGCATKGFVTERVDDRAAEVEAAVDARDRRAAAGIGRVRDDHTAAGGPASRGRRDGQ